MTIRYYVCWRILYTIYWNVDPFCWAFEDRFPRLGYWLNEGMSSVGIRLKFLLPERVAAKGTPV